MVCSEGSGEPIPGGTRAPSEPESGRRLRPRPRPIHVIPDVSISTPAQLADVLAEYAEEIDRVCAIYLSDPRDVEDARQEAVLRALEHFEEVRGDVLRYLLTEARYACYRIRYAKQRRARTAPPPPPAPENPEGLAVALVLGQVVDRLDPTEREVIGYSLAGYTQGETAKALRWNMSTVGTVLWRARQRARGISGVTFPGLVGLPLWHRVRERVARWRLRGRGAVAARSWWLGVPVEPWPHAALAAVLATLVLAGPVSLAPGGTVPPRTPAQTVPPTGGTAVASPTTPPAPLPAARPGAHGGLAGLLVDLPLSATFGLRLPSSAATTPDNTRLIDVQPSPDYHRDHTIIALGLGTTCGCKVLFRSTDGGATWPQGQGPVPGLDGVDEVRLPPDYPHDPRVFLAAPGNGTPTVVAATWDAPFLPLPIPSGHIAFAAGFDSGDPSLYVAGQTGVWRYDMGSGQLDLLVQQTGTVELASLGTPYGGNGALVLAPPHAIVRTGPAAATPPAPTAVLLSCEAAGCTQLAVLHFAFAAVGQLVVSRGYASDHTVIAYAYADIERSTDGGHRFVAVAPPAITAVQGAAIATDGGRDARMWAVVWSGSRGRVMWSPASGVTSWHDATGRDPLFDVNAGIVVPVDSQRVLYMVEDQGVRCTVDGGVSWLPRCPPVEQ